MSFGSFEPKENIIDKQNYFAIIKHFVLILPDKECI